MTEKKEDAIFILTIINPLAVAWIRRDKHADRSYFLLFVLSVLIGPHGVWYGWRCWKRIDYKIIIFWKAYKTHIKIKKKNKQSHASWAESNIHPAMFIMYCELHELFWQNFNPSQYPSLKKIETLWFRVIDAQYLLKPFFACYESLSKKLTANDD